MGISKKIMDSALRVKCEELGFKKKGLCYYRETSNNPFHDLLFWGKSHYSDGDAIGAFIGVHHETIEQLYVKLTGNPQKTPLSIIYINIGYLKPTGVYENCFFNDNSNLEMIVHQLFQDVQKYAYHFWNEYENIDRLIEAFENKEPYFKDKDRRFIFLPLLFYISNQKNNGIEIMNSMIQEGYVLNDFTKEFFYRYCDCL